MDKGPAWFVPSYDDGFYPLEGCGWVCGGEEGKPFFFFCFLAGAAASACAAVLLSPGCGEEGDDEEVDKGGCEDK